MSARTLQVISATIDPVTRVIVIDLKLRPEAASHQGLYQTISNNLNGADPTPTFTKTLGVTNGVRNGDCDLRVSLQT